MFYIHPVGAAGHNPVGVGGPVDPSDPEVVLVQEGSLVSGRGGTKENKAVSILDFKAIRQKTGKTSNGEVLFN